MTQYFNVSPQAFADYAGSEQEAWRDLAGCHLCCDSLGRGTIGGVDILPAKTFVYVQFSQDYRFFEPDDFRKGEEIYVLMVRDLSLE